MPIGFFVLFFTKSEIEMCLISKCYPIGKKSVGRGAWEPPGASSSSVKCCVPNTPWFLRPFKVTSPCHQKLFIPKSRSGVCSVPCEVRWGRAVGRWKVEVGGVLCQQSPFPPGAPVLSHRALLARKKENAHWKATPPGGPRKHCTQAEGCRRQAVKGRAGAAFR